MSEPQINTRVLVVDDNRDIALSFKKILTPVPTDDSLDALLNDVLGEKSRTLSPWTFDVDTAFSGASAIEAVEDSLRRKRPYAVVFMDVRMPPGIDGIKAIQKIWEIDREVQAVVCTAYSDYNWPEMAQKLPRISQWLILKKPFSNTEVLQLAHALTMKWHLSNLQRTCLDSFDSKMAQHASVIQQAGDLSTKESPDWRSNLQEAIKDSQRSIEQMRSTFEKLRNEAGRLRPREEP